MSAIPLRKLEGKYEILEKFREGGMGAIYKVRHRLLDEVRVIKVMRPHLVADEELQERFLREARLAIKLRHPNIAQLYDFTVDEEDGTAYIVMEFIDGMTLEDVLKATGPPPLGLALEIAQQSLRALGYLHGKGLIHRDISPDNLMLTEDTDGKPLVKLIDLGIAKALAGGEGKNTATGMYLGKVRYSSPEQFGAEGMTMDARGDLYSFGVVLYELLTGRYPIQGRDPSAIIAGHLFRPPLDFTESDPQGRVPPGLRDVVLSALAKSPDERPQNAQRFSRSVAGFRAMADLSREDLERALSRPQQEASLAPPGRLVTSTQNRLDQQFDLTTTPPPGKLAARPQDTRPVVVPIRPNDTQIRGLAASIEQSLAAGDLAAAERELGWALETCGEQTELAALRGRLAEQQEEQREAERAREVASSIAAIEATLARGDYRAAEAQLYAAEASLGAQPAFPALYERVAELRRLELEAKVAAQVASARQLAAAGSFDPAREALKRARRLDPKNAGIEAAAAEIEAAVAAAAKAEAARAEAAALEAARVEAAAAAKARTEEAARRQAEERRRAGRVAALAAEFEETSRRWEKHRPRAAGPAAAKPEGKPAAPAELEPRLAGAATVPISTAEAEAADRRQAAERIRAERLAEAVAKIHEHVDRGEAEEAGQLLDRAVAAFGPADPLREQWLRLEELRRRARS